MVEIVVIGRDGSEAVLHGAVGTSLMEALRDNGVDELLALCGGCCSCATCHVYLDDETFAKLPERSNDENDLLESSDQRNSMSRLSCQISLAEELKGMRVIIAPED